MLIENSAGQMDFHMLTVEDRGVVQEVTLAAGLRNCNLTFANLIGWQFWFNTEVCVKGDVAVFRFNMDGRRAYMVCCAEPPSERLLGLLCADAAQWGSELRIIGLEDDYADYVKSLMPDRVDIEPRRSQYDYIYLRQELAEMKGKNLKAKRNHVNKFLSEHPAFEYVDLTPERFGECRELSMLWRNEVHQDTPFYDETVRAERRAMETVLAHWDELGMRGGCIYDGGRMVAFTYGAAVTYDTFDVCVEKADRTIDGAFNIINQQFASHLPEQYVYVNREEDMGLEGLRKSKLSYHPHTLLGFNNVTISCR
ncbi:MAG: DUF2156 domain-containing protein [Bacteroidales bacterium]|nr:DUF2156 domain-containing protein [Bacteroidales bacterium]